MSGTDYDDSNPAIQYSSGWTAQTGTSPQQFMSTSHTTTVKGASATIKFQGSRLVLYLTVPEGSGEESITWTLDGGNAGSNTRHRHDGTTYYQDNWYDSGPLTSGAHTFVVANAEDGAPFVFDKVNVIGSLVGAQQQPPAPPKPPTTTAAVPAGTPTAPTTQQTQVQTVVSTQVQTVATMVVQTSGGSSSVSPTETGSALALASGSSLAAASSSGMSQSRSVSGTGGGTILVSTQYVTTGADGATSTIHTVTQLSASTSSPSSISATQKSSFPLAAVIGAVIGALALIVFGLICLCLIKRRKTGSRFGKLQEPGQDAERQASLRRRPTDISPFHIDSVPARLGGGGAAVSRSASNSSGTSGNIVSEKAQLHFGPDSPLSNSPSADSRGSPAVSTTAFSPSASIPGQPNLRQPADIPDFRPEVDAGLYHPHNSSIDTRGMVLAYVPVNHLLQSPRDSRGAPPSYQSAATRTHARPESVPPPMPPLGSINTSNPSTVTLEYVTPVSATTQEETRLPVHPARRVSELSTSPRGNEELGDLPWAHGW